MPKLWIREYAQMGSAQTPPYAGGGTRVDSAPVPVEPGLVDQNPDIGVVSNPFNQNTRLVSIISDVAFHYVVGSGTPDATTANMRVAAGVEKTICVTPGHKIDTVAAS